MALIVKKFGGSSVATPEKIFNIVDRVLREKQADDKIVLVVSAMGDTTDDLVALAKQVTSKPYGREMDRLLSTGEQVTIALMAMAFNERGQESVSLTVIKQVLQVVIRLIKVAFWALILIVCLKLWMKVKL